jgi:tetratricopeptide (TPR) repeat protein
MAYYYTGNFNKAEEAFTFVSIHVPLIEVFNDLGVVAARRGKKEATELFERVVQADSRDPDYRFNYAVSLARGGDVPGAAKQLREGLAIKSQDTEAKALLDALSRSNAVPAKLPLERIKSNYDETSYRQLAAEIQNATEERHSKMSPTEHAAAHVARGREFMQQQSFDQAESEFRQAILASQFSVEAHAGLAGALEEQDQFTEARSEAIAANRIKFSAEAFLTLARIDMKQGKLESARDNVDRALKMDPANPVAAELKKSIASQLADRPQSTQKP